MASSQIVTGQYVAITQASASVAERIVAQFIDYIVITMYYSTIYAILITMGTLEVLGNTWLIYILVFLVVVPGAIYHPMLEFLNHGQSVGKAIMKIQVTMLDGSTPTVGAYFMRWVLMAIDEMGLGVLFIMFTKNNQRLGDLAAGTVVIKKHDPSKVSYMLSDQHFVAAGYKPTYPEAADLTLNQVEIISRTYYSQQKNKEELIALLAVKIQEHLGIDPMGMDPATFISVVSNDYHYYASTLEV